MDGLLIALVAAGGTIVVAFLTFLTARLAQRGVREQTQIQERNVVLEGYDKLNEDLAARNAQLNIDIDKMRARLDFIEVAQEDMRTRVLDLGQQTTRDRQAITELIAYAHRLRDVLTAHRIDVPAGPNGVVGHDWSTGPRRFGATEDN